MLGNSSKKERYLLYSMGKIGLSPRGKSFEFSVKLSIPRIA
jgi:hypothetical protein